MNRKFLFPLGLVLIIAALLACGSSDSNTGTSTGTTPGAPTTTPQPAKHFVLNETVNVGNTWEVVVTGVQTSTGNEYIGPEPGNVYLLIHVTLKNISDKEQSLYGTAGWTLKDTSGQKYDSAYVPDAPPSPDGKIEAGGPAKGTLTYEVPATTTEFRLSFEANFFASGQTIWDLTLP